MSVISHVLVANRGEIACRVIRTCKALGIRTTAVYSDADRGAPHTIDADQAVHLGASEPSASYLDGGKVIAAARATGADAIHPGYGFLSENADFADAVLATGLTWIGPPPAAMRALGDKARAREAAVNNGVPVVPGYDGADASDAAFAEAAARIGYPVLIKASNGGGGRGMRRVDSPEGLSDALAAARREAITAFGSDRLLLERLVDRPRHIEVQFLADAHGGAVYLFERECSIQRRHQKIIEEAPSSVVSDDLRARLGDAAVRVATSAGYVGAGTVEFLVEGDRFYLLEMNARLQVEHPVTEMITGLDLVELQLAIAEGKRLPFAQAELRVNGHAIEVRVCAEDPMRDFLPAAGRLVRFDLPSDAGVRVDAGFIGGQDVPSFYDSLLAKIIAWGPDRETATRRLIRAVDRAWVPGVATNLPLLRAIARHPRWASGDLHTGFLAENGLPTAPPLNLDQGAIAAVVAGWHERRDAERPSGWRIEGSSVQIDTFACGDAKIEARWRDVGDALDVTLGGITHRVRVIARISDAWTIEWNGVLRTWRIATVGQGDDALFYVHLGDGESFVRLIPRFPSPIAAVEPGSLVSATPGKVVVVTVSVGDLVARGQLLVVIEAMKMEHRVVAPTAGTVAEVRVRPGDAVQQGTLLARIDAGNDAG